ncbi:MAG: hypothetical protein ACUVWZ_00160 [Anaerolineae bacterium]
MQATVNHSEKRILIFRSLLLAVPLGLLGVLVFVLSSNAYVTQKGETTLVDFDSGTFIYTGLLDIPEQGVDSVQLLPIGLTGEWEVANRSLPLRLTDHAVVMNGDAIYVVGGTDQDYVVHNEVFMTRMGLDGQLSPWQSQNPLPAPRSAAAIAVHPHDADTSFLYVMGGIGPAPAFAATDTVYYAAISNATGQVGTWQLNSQSLPNSVYYAAAVEHEGALYVIGGAGDSVFDQVYYATVQADGSLDPFIATSSLPEPLYDGLAIVYEGESFDTLYYIGGRNSITSTFRVYFADFLPGGGLSAWQLSEGNLPGHIFGHDGTLLNGEIILTGGIVDSINPYVGISNTVEAALVDPGNSAFRLYDWCLGVPPPTCTIGAWQTGSLLPDVRARHGMASGHGYLYVLGGVDATQYPRDTIYVGAVTGFGARYSPEGYYLSDPIDLGAGVALRRLSWGTTIHDPAHMGLGMQFRHSSDGQIWSDWSASVDSISGTNQIDLVPPLTGIHYLQYRAHFTTTVTHASPLLDWVEIYYEVPDPEVAVHKDTGGVMTVTPDDNLEYTIYYTNYGGWTAENVILTETLPAHTSYAGGSEWHQVASTNVYTYLVGNLAPGASGSVPFRIKVDSDVPLETHYLTNYIEIGYPPMLDALAEWVIDPEPGNNTFALATHFTPYAITIAKDSDPPPGEAVAPGEIITYTLTYSNPMGAVTVPQAYIVDVLPEHVTYIPGTIFGPGADASNPRELRWDLDTVGPGEIHQVGYAVQVDSSTPLGTVLSNTATLYSDIGRPKTSNCVENLVVAKTYKLEVSKRAVPSAGSVVTPGSLITYTLYYTNAGFIPVSQAVLTEVFDLNQSYSLVSANPPPDVPPNVWNLGPLDPGRKGAVDLVVRLDDVLPSNWIVANQAVIDSPEGLPFYTPVITHLVMNPPGVPLVDLVVGNMRLEPSQPKPGQPVDFYATISNTGNLDANAYFWVELYLKAAPSEPPGGPSDHDQGYCLNNCSIKRSYHLFFVANLKKGQKKDISFLDDRLFFPVEGVYEVYVQVDVAFTDSDPRYNFYWGFYPEQDEGNNIAYKTVFVGGVPRVYLPAVYKRWP